MKFAAAGVTDVGRERGHNEDAFLVDEALGLFLVADGMGGHQAGEVASALARDAVAESLRATTETDRLKALDEAVRFANSRVVQHGYENRAHKGLGTTIVAVLTDGSSVGIAHAGDSRCYRLRDGQLRRLTRDHSLVEELSGEDPAVMAVLSSYQNVITRALGMGMDIAPDLKRESILPGDLLLLCSDGLSGVVGEDRMRELLLGSNELDKVAQQLIDNANDRGGPDNITAVVVRVEAE